MRFQGIARLIPADFIITERYSGRCTLSSQGEGQPLRMGDRQMSRSSLQAQFPYCKDILE